MQLCTLKYTSDMFAKPKITLSNIPDEKTTYKMFGAYWSFLFDTMFWCMFGWDVCRTLGIFEVQRTVFQ